jgi:protein gp37
MADKTGIEWTDATWNPVRGCSRKDRGCLHCYAEVQAARIERMDRGRGVAVGEGSYDGLTKIVNGRPTWTGELRQVPDLLDQPLRWRRPRLIFANSMSDLFHANVPFDFVDQVFAIMALAPQHTFQVLTKRQDRMAEYLSAADLQERISLLADDMAAKYRRQRADEVAGGAVFWPMPHVWLGFSAHDQASFDNRWQDARKVAELGWLTWVSLEPLLGPVDLSEVLDAEWSREGWQSNQHALDMPLLSWVVVGGESGDLAEPMHPDWPGLLRDQCKAVGVPYLFKQWGEWAPFEELSEELRARDLDPIIVRFDGSTCQGEFVGNNRLMLRTGKKASGRLLKGIEHNGYPA